MIRLFLSLVLIVQLPEKLLESLQQLKDFDPKAFETIHKSGEQVVSIRINPSKLTIDNSQLPIENKVHWSDYGYYLSSRPSFTFDPLFHAGCYYVQEASSMFLEQALKQTLDLSRPLKILDLAAAPGGKSTHIQSLISKNSLLVSNEVIRPRANILKDNIVKWGGGNVVVTNNDPRDFRRLENYFDAIVVDAPCSGSGLFRRDEAAIHEWSLNQVQLCSQRQQRILADVWPALKKNGILIYATCSYSKEEDEDILDWMTQELSIAHCQLAIDPGWSITEIQTVPGAYGYRFWPYKVRGEGFFMTALKKLEGENEFHLKAKKNIELLNKKEGEIVTNWVKQTTCQFMKIQNTVYAVPENLLSELNRLIGNLHIIYSGTMIGELVPGKLVPAHALAMSPLASDHIERMELDYEEAIRYLQKKDPHIHIKNKGWQLVTYHHHPLGWINVLANRINNYYPKELRILKDI